MIRIVHVPVQIARVDNVDVEWQPNIVEYRLEVAPQHLDAGEALGHAHGDVARVDVHLHARVTYRGGGGGGLHAHIRAHERAQFTLIP
jgi:hypothetical protein